jgi:hypothetical protein
MALDTVYSKHYQLLKTAFEDHIKKMTDNLIKIDNYPSPSQNVRDSTLPTQLSSSSQLNNTQGIQ